MDENCVFCRILSGGLAASIVTETEAALAFMDINQPSPGHVLVIPRAHVVDIDGLDDETGAALFQLTCRVARATRRALAADGLNLWQSNGRAGGQEVFHFHMHIIARFVGDRDRIHLSLQHHLPPKQELDQLAARIRAALDSA